MSDTLIIAVLTDNSSFGYGVYSAIDSINSNRLTVHHSGTRPNRSPETTCHPNFNAIASKANAFLDNQEKITEVRIISERTATDLVGKLKDIDEKKILVGMVIVDKIGERSAKQRGSEIENELDIFYRRLEENDIDYERSSYSDIVFISERNWLDNPFRNAIDYRLMVMSPVPWIFQAGLLCQFVNYLQHTRLNKWAQRRLKSPEGKILLGDELVKFMEFNHGKNWLLSCYTGSVISSLIKQVEHDAEILDAYCLRGLSEHGMACGAFINWRLYRRSYLIIITSAMVDEFKGTLANLRQSGAKGLIVCADAKPGKWFGFQGTIDTESDIRNILNARNIPFVYLHDNDNKEQDLQEAFGLYHKTAGPVVIIATQDVLESRDNTQRTLHYGNRLATTETFAIDEASMDEVIELINEKPIHLLWQCGALTEEEAQLTREIAHKGGIALCEALSSPGNIARYYRGKRLDNHIGVLGQYGSSQEVFEFLHTNGKLNPKTAQSIFFLKGKIGQIDSPFSDGANERKLHIVQINKQRKHIAPFTDIGLCMPVLDFLKKIVHRIAVEPEILARRWEKIHRHNRPRVSAFGLVPSLPMTPNYFFHEINKTLEALIENEAYDYVGMYDVGHCGTLATRNISRTGPGYSGWYGRGSMGDALQATGFMAFTAHTNVLGFVGDGARSITSDILPGLLENLENSKKPIEHNVTIFFFMNGAFSLINSYQERIMFKPGGRQMMLINDQEFMNIKEWQREFCGVGINQYLMKTYDPERVRSIITQKPSVNFIYVPLVNNNDGISILDIGNWQYFDGGDISVMH
uniref:Acetolactate synthase large subunit n=1 Tax=Candidatus Kentrum sp. LFY TaxID=2126342 RepID=A0A450V1K2_9GAMM|nr:MAG: hypothetical protein BECKLFY1418B_GA0070995_11263 [Candidatus Kentron sp. LFY]